MTIVLKNNADYLQRALLATPLSDLLADSASSPLPPTNTAIDQAIKTINLIQGWIIWMGYLFRSAHKRLGNLNGSQVQFIVNQTLIESNYAAIMTRVKLHLSN